jgi:hypothetical protein
MDGDPPLTQPQATYLLDLYLRQIRLQAPRVDAVRTSDESDGALLDQLAEVGLLLGALSSFERTLRVLANSGFANATRLNAIHEEFMGAIPDLAHIRNALTHGEDWIRGLGRAGKGVRGKYNGASMLVSRDTGEVLANSFHHEAGSITFTARAAVDAVDAPARHYARIASRRCVDVRAARSAQAAEIRTSSRVIRT